MTRSTTRPSAPADVLLVDTSVWSLAFRRDQPPDDPRVDHLRRYLVEGSELVVTGFILQELLQGVKGPKQRRQLIERFAALASVDPDRAAHVAAAEVRNACRRRGVQLTTIDALIAALCIRHDLTLLTADVDFYHAARIVPLQVWAS